MKPTSIAGATRKLGAPSDWNAERDGECETIEIRDEAIDGGGNLVQSAWMPDEAERQALYHGQPVILHVWGSNMPPVAMTVEPQPERPHSNVLQGKFGQKVHDAMAAALMESASPVESGWNVMRDLLIEPDTTHQQLQAHKFAFFAGAQHLYALVMATLSPGSEITDGDLRRMGNLHKELDDWAKAVQGNMTRGTTQ